MAPAQQSPTIALGLQQQRALQQQALQQVALQQAALQQQALQAALQQQQQQQQHHALLQQQAAQQHQQALHQAAQQQQQALLQAAHQHHQALQQQQPQPWHLAPGAPSAAETHGLWTSQLVPAPQVAPVAGEPHLLPWLVAGPAEAGPGTAASWLMAPAPAFCAQRGVYADLPSPLHRMRATSAGSACAPSVGIPPVGPVPLGGGCVAPSFPVQYGIPTPMLPQGSPVHGECRAWGMPPEERACSATWEDSQRAEEVSGVKVKAEADLLTARVGEKRPRTLQEGQEGAASPPMRPQDVGLDESQLAQPHAQPSPAPVASPGSKAPPPPSGLWQPEIL